MWDAVSKNVVLTAGVALIIVAVSQFEKNLLFGLISVGLGLTCFSQYSRMVERQTVAKAYQTLMEFLKAVREEVQREEKRNPLST